MVENIKHEIECQRRNVTPKEFYAYCKKRCALKDIDIESYTGFETWFNPDEKTKQEHTRYEHEWEEGKKQIETIKYMPCDIHLYLSDTYNFIMEFEFDTETKGHGYLYIKEYEV